jgi:glycosyltransferase involved in cell wall biosynthesis
LSDIKVPSLVSKEAARIALSLPPKAFIFGFAGRLIERKGWRDFLECARHFSSDPNIIWLIAGDGPEQRLLYELCGESKYNMVRPIGFQQEMDSFYRSLDACIIPSHWEPHGLVQLEAQSYGLPIIATDVPGMNETLSAGTNALLFEARDIPALVAHCRALMEDPRLLSSLSDGSLANARNFTVQKYHDDLESSYLRL